MFAKLIETLKANPRTLVFTEGTDARILGSFAAGESVSTISVEGDWYKVKYGDQVGYCYGDYLK